jgi:hypothetical protein
MVMGTSEVYTLPEVTVAHSLLVVQAADIAGEEAREVETVEENLALGIHGFLDCMLAVM